MNMNRRDFLRCAVLGASSMVAPGLLGCQSSNTRTTTVATTNNNRIPPYTPAVPESVRTSTGAYEIRQAASIQDIIDAFESDHGIQMKGDRWFDIKFGLLVWDQTGGHSVLDRYTVNR